jgi:hypothetical protein
LVAVNVKRKGRRAKDAKARNDIIIAAFAQTFANFALKVLCGLIRQRLQEIDEEPTPPNLQ